MPSTLPGGTWEQMDHVNLVEVYLLRIPTLSICPHLRESVSPSPFRKVQSQSDWGHHIRGTCMEGFCVGPCDVAWQRTNWR